MKAHDQHEYGGPDVVHLEDVPKPVPKDDERLVKILATTVTSADWRALTPSMPRGFGLMGRLVFGVRAPRRPILCQEMAGVVEAVGARVTSFRPGDVVFASPGVRTGCHAQYQTVREGGHVAKKPANLSFDEAAALLVLYFLRKAKLRAGERVLVRGAAVGVGTAMLHLAAHMGARVTGAASAQNASVVSSVGAARVLDREKNDLFADTYDVIVDTVGATTLAQGKKALAEGGRSLGVLMDLPSMLAAPLAGLGDSRRIVTGVAPGARRSRASSPSWPSAAR